MMDERPLATDAPTETDPVSVTVASGSKYRSHILAAAHDLDARGETNNAEDTLERHATVVRLTTVREAREVRDAAIHALNRGRHPGGHNTRQSIKRVRDEAADAVDAHERAMSRTRDPDDMPADPMDRSATDYDVDDCLPDDDDDENHRIMTDGGVDTGGRHVDMAPAEPMEEPRADPHDPIEHIPAAIRVAVGTLCRERDVSFVRWNGSNTTFTACVTLRTDGYVSDWMLPAGVQVRGATVPLDSGCIDIKLKTSRPD